MTTLGPNSHGCTAHCPRTGIRYCLAVPGGPGDQPGPSTAVVFLNGIGLDLEGFCDPIAALALPWALAKYPYRHGLHVGLTVPGFENLADRTDRALLSMADQAGRVAAFLEGFLETHPVAQVVLYGFSFGSDLAVDLLPALAGKVAVARVVLTELNVSAHSCFISQRIIASCQAAATPGQDLQRKAYSQFVSRVVKAHAEGHLNAALMADMALYFRTIVNKDWHQLAHSAREVSQAPEARIARLLELSAATPTTQFDLVFSDPLDLAACRAQLGTWQAPLGQFRLFDSTVHEHFHHMSRAGVLENLCGTLRMVDLAAGADA